MSKNNFKILRGLVYIKGGCFQMGCLSRQTAAVAGQEQAIAARPVWQWPLAVLAVVLPVGCAATRTYVYPQTACSPDELPAHEVCVDSFWLGKYEVSNREYRAYRSSHDSGDYGGKSLDNNNQPVVEVSWEDARDYASWLAGKSGKAIRLPTEAEWEYAARGGTSTVRFWGDSPDKACGYANVHDQTSKRVNTDFDWTHHNCDDGYAVTAPVGSFKENPYGLSDMLGNVWEWCSDRYDKDYYSSSPGKNPQGAAYSSRRVLRGGGWYIFPAFVRSASRGGLEPSSRNSSLGFRLAFVEGSR
jgi:formylglycine-generating enzyme required for sulfatase activity